MSEASPYPAGKTFLDTLKKSFVDVPINKEKDNAIPTTEFLEAAESLTTLFDVLGSVAFTPVKSDMTGNIKKIRDRQLAAPLESEDLQSLVRNELKTKKHTATGGIGVARPVILFNSCSASSHASAPSLIPSSSPETHTDTLTHSGLEFTSLGISHNLSKPADELSVSFREAYSTTLKPHHSFMVKPIFSAAMSACPYRKDFYAKLGGDQQQVEKELTAWLAALAVIVGILKEFLARKEAKW